MSEVWVLILIFRRQIVARSVLVASLYAMIVTFFAVVTAGGAPFGILELSDSAKWLRELDPWTVFLIVFVIANLSDYVRTYQATLIDRRNFRVLADLSQQELTAAEDPLSDVPARRAALNGRRRLLEHVLSVVPGIVALVVLGVSLLLLGVPVAAATLGAVAVALPLLLPALVARFDRRRTQLLHRATQPDRPGRGADRLVRAEARLQVAVERASIIVDRPLERMRVAWPLTLGSVFAVLAAGVAAVFALSDKPTLLIVMLILSSRAIVGTTQQLLDTAFFASAVRQLEESDSGVEVI